MEGEPTTAGCRAVADRAVPAPRDAACMAGARAAGARIVGRTNLHELALGVTGINPWYGTPVNPLDPTRVPGGSSSGSAVAVAVGDADVAYGSDTGGSVRIPAACCGTAGLKTTWGRIPLDDVWPLSPSFDTVGPHGARRRRSGPRHGVARTGLRGGRDNGRDHRPPPAPGGSADRRRGRQGPARRRMARPRAGRAPSGTRPRGTPGSCSWSRPGSPTGRSVARDPGGIGHLVRERLAMGASFDAATIASRVGGAAGVEADPDGAASSRSTFSSRPR